MKYCLVTGATGFVGSALVAEMEARGLPVRGAARSPTGRASFACGDIGPDTRWADALAGAGSIVHAAACVHSPAADEERYHRVNVEGTLALARQAAEAGVSRFVFLSSIKVNGEETAPGHPFTEDDPPAPRDAYGRSKAKAEERLRELAARTGIEVVIVRPPLVYGPGVKANFLSMMRWLERGLPLPFGAIDNRRSLVSLANLVDFIILCLSHPRAANETFIVTDGEDMSTTELLTRTASAMGKAPRLLPIPERLLVGAAAAVGQTDKARRLVGSLQASGAKAREMLGWTPPTSVDDGLRAAATAWLARSSS